MPPEEKEIQRTSAQRRAAVRAAEADLAKVEQGLNRNKRRLDKFKNTAIKDLHEGKEGSVSTTSLTFRPSDISEWGLAAVAVGRRHRYY